MIGFKSLLFIPLLVIGGISLVWYKQYVCLCGYCAIGAAASFLIVYGLILAWLLGFFEKITVVEKKRGPYVYYYRNYQCGYQEAMETHMKLFTSKQCETLMKLPGMGYLSIYWDDPFAIENENLCRTTTGYVFPPAGNATAEEIFNSIGMEKANLPEWAAAEASMKTRIFLAFGVAPMRLIGPICDYVAKKYPDMIGENMPNHVIYEYCEAMNETTYGYAIDKGGNALAALAPFKTPPMSEKGKKMTKEWYEKMKKSQ